MNVCRPSKPWRALALMAVLLTPRAQAQGGHRLELCLPIENPEALAALRRWIPQIEVRTSPQSDCPRSPFTYQARFSQQEGRVVLVITAPNGGKVERVLPWLDSRQAPLEQLAAKGRLSEFSVLLEGLTTELSLRAPRGAVAEEPSGGAEAASPADGASRSPTARAGAGSSRSRTPSRPSETPPSNSSSGSGVSSERLWVPGSGSTPAAEPGAQPSVTNDVLVEVPAVRAAPPPSQPRWVVEVGATPRWRTPGLWTVEVCAGFGWGPLRLYLAWAPTARWSLEGRPVSLDSLSGTLLWQPTLWARGGWALEAALGLAVERLELRRLDVGGARGHDFWDVGPRAGLRLTRFFGPTSAALRADGTWSPTARVVQIPQGPSAVLNTVSIGVSLLFGWRW